MKSLTFEATLLVFLMVTSNFIISFGNRRNNMFNVMKFGGNRDGKTDNYNAFSNAWNAACAAERNSNIPTFIVPHGSFLLKPFTFQGPCKSDAINIKIIGNIVAPSGSEWPSCNFVNWIELRDVNGLIVDGSGTIDGQGSTWWTNTGVTDKYCTTNPMALHFHDCNNLEINGINHINSAGGHIGINGCQNVSIYNTKITAPENSPNTDGIDISSSSYINIYDSVIGTGDDCIAINGGCSFINITRLTCGPGHGISVGSLGRGQEPETVEEVSVQNCTFINTQNGARIKTWPGGSGYAKKISFNQIKLQDAQNPIIIDQHYCNGAHNCPDKGAAVRVSDITYNGIEGTSATKQAIKLDCANIGCENIVMENINITSYNPPNDVQSFCSNVHGTSISTTPNVPCLKST